MTDLSPKGAALGQKLDVKLAELDEAIEKARQNELHDIAGMDQDVAEICEGIVALPLDDILILEPRMGRAISRLEELAQELKAYKDRINTGPDNGQT